ncbi:MAG TPA: glutaredoxin domain-containing protein [Candidatus Lumbricidophila sp.]|nr:glutaredoxin domain-containing protein [Candidatus Lumbricidophila sp.]
MSSTAPSAEQEPTPVLIVWTKTQSVCVQCNATKRKLDEAGIPYVTHSLEENPAQTEAFKNQGFASAPIVISATETWSGFCPDLLNREIKTWREAQLVSA